MGRYGASLALTAVLAASAMGATAFADQASDELGIFGLAQPQGPAAPSYLRMHHPLWLLDRCRQVKAGQLERKKVEGLVGRNALDALLQMDLDALLQKLTGPPAAGTVPSTNSLWYQMLTDGETAPLPPADHFPESLDFHEVQPGDSPLRVLHVTAPADGPLQAQVPSGSAFNVVAMRSYSGLIVAPERRPPGRDDARRQPKRPQEFRTMEMSRTQPPWVLPVRAGQDVDILVELPVDPAVPPGQLISSVITVGDPIYSVWRQDVPMQAQPALKVDVKITIDAPQRSFDVVQDLSYNPNVPRIVAIPLWVSNPAPPVPVKGSVKPVSLPQGVSMPTFNFTLQPQQTANLSFWISIDRSSPVWLDEGNPQPFSIKVSYQTLSIPYGSRTEVVDFDFTIYPSTQSWHVAGSALGVNCTQDLLLFSDGYVARNGYCENFNAYNANIVAKGTLAGISGVVQDFYGLGWFSYRNTWSSFTFSYFQSNYVYVRSQPLLMSWNIHTFF